ncbi:MAG: hypothetical protein ABL897_06590 [Hyphomicrobium sp.]
MTRQRTAAKSAACVAAALLFASGFGLGLSQTSAQAAPDAAAPSDAAIALELNKLETTDKGCRAYIVVNNPTDTVYQSYKLDLVLFQADGVIGRRVALDLAPLKAQKKTVKLFDLEGIACDKIGSFLINDVMDCKTEAGAADNCLQRMTTSTLSNVKLSK